MSAVEQIKMESVVRLKALLDQAAALRRVGVNVETIIADLERVLHGWTGQTQKQAVLSDLASTGHLATPSYGCECS